MILDVEKAAVQLVGIFRRQTFDLVNNDRFNGNKTIFKQSFGVYYKIQYFIFKCDNASAVFKGQIHSICIVMGGTKIPFKIDIYRSDDISREMTFKLIFKFICRVTPSKFFVVFLGNVDCRILDFSRWVMNHCITCFLYWIFTAAHDNCCCAFFITRYGIYCCKKRPEIH